MCAAGLFLSIERLRCLMAAKPAVQVKDPANLYSSFGQIMTLSVKFIFLSLTPLLRFVAKTAFQVLISLHDGLLER